MFIHDERPKDCHSMPHIEGAFPHNAHVLPVIQVTLPKTNLKTTHNVHRSKLQVNITEQY